MFAGFPKAGRKIAVYFNAYFDESGTNLSSRVISVGGCINYADTWERFSSEWEGRLDEWGLSHFHTADWESLLGEYRTWDKPLAERRLRELLDIIYKHGIATFGWAVARKEFDQVIAPLPAAKRRCGGAYGFLGQQSVRQVRYTWGDFFTSHARAGDLDYVSYFFESGCSGYGKIEEAWYRERETLRWQDALITRVNKKEHPPLQVADIVAYELRKMYPTAAGWVPKGELRYPAQQLFRYSHYWFYMTGSILRHHMLRLADEW